MCVSSRDSFFRYCLSLFVVTAAAAAEAQTAVQSSPLPSLPQVLARVAASHPSLVAFPFEQRAASALVEQAGTRPIPTLELTLENVLGTGATRGLDSLEATVQASQTFERGDKRLRRVEVASREQAIIASEQALALTEVQIATANAYVDLVAATARAAIAAEPLRLARETVDAVGARVKSGFSSDAELARSRAQLAVAQADYAIAESELATTRATLAALWAASPDEAAGSAPEIRLPDELPPLETFSARLARHPQLAHQQARIEQRRSQLKLEQAQAAGDITVAGGVRFLREGSDAAIVAGVSLPLPSRHRNQGAIRAARESLAGAERAVEASEQTLRVSLDSAWRELVSAHRLARVLRREALPAAVEALELVRQGYRQGQIPLLEVFDAQRNLAAIRGDLAAREAACAKALVRVEALTDPSFSATTRLFVQP